VIYRSLTISLHREWVTQATRALLASPLRKSAQQLVFAGCLMALPE